MALDPWYKAALLHEEDREGRSSSPRTNARPGQAGR